MQLADAVARLAARHDPLPPGLAALDPVVLGRPGEPPARVARPTAATRDAAVLVLLYPDAAGEAHLVLIERPAAPNDRHAGQVSFPGGKRDPGDTFPDGTALREAAEEVGLDPVRDPVRLLGTLDPVDVRVSGFLLVPVVGIAERDPSLAADPREVARILRVPVRAFLPDAPVEIVEEERDGWRLRYGAFPVGELRVWGATARVLGQLGAVLGTDGTTNG
ncbi:MAG: NUDIX hydrolase [Chloroflexota bacterium]